MITYFNMKAALANIGKAYTRSIGLKRSDIEPPAHTRGVAAKQPPMNRKVSCDPIFGAKPDAMMIIDIYGTSTNGLRYGTSDKSPDPEANQKEASCQRFCYFTDSKFLRCWHQGSGVDTRCEADYPAYGGDIHTTLTRLVSDLLFLQRRGRTSHQTA